MTRGPATTVECNHDGCATRLVFAQRDGRWLPYDAEALDPFSDRGTGAHVLIGSQAMTLTDAIEHFTVRCESEPRSRDLVAGYPAHRPHFHDRDNETHDWAASP